MPKWKKYCPNFLLLQSKVISTRKLIVLKMLGEILLNFCLGPKTEISCWDPRFSVRSKIHVFCSTVLSEVLILVPNQNCARKKFMLGFWPLLEITSLKLIWGKRFFNSQPCSKGPTRWAQICFLFYLFALACFRQFT